MTKVTRRGFIKRVVFGVIGIILLDSLWFEKYVIDWNYFDISENENKLKIIQISDLHIKEVRSFHKSIVKKINNVNPDIVFITGDSVDSTDKINELDTFLGLMNNSIPKFSITGNWEYWGDVDLTKLNETYSKHNCKLLINETEIIRKDGRNISIIGIDDLVGGNADFKKAIQDFSKTDTNIILTHCPQHRDVIDKENEELKIDLVLSGHTHGGQINIFGYAPFTPQGSGRYIKGWYENEKSKMYVSKGIGTSIFPLRFGSRAEIVEIDI